MSGLRAPFPYFGGKSRAAPLVWRALGDVQTYVEPFAGSLAILLGRPTEPKIETCNDVDCYLSCFWRAVQADPDAVARHADWPVNEADLHARHKWLVNQTEFRERMMSDPEYFDPKIAGWWVWGISTWIGGGWCAVREDPPRRRPNADAWAHGHGVHQSAGGIGHKNGLHRKRPQLWKQGNGVHGLTVHGKRPTVSGTHHGKGINVIEVARKLPSCDGRGDRIQIPAVDGFGGKGVSGPRAEGLVEWFRQLQERLRRVRVCCGDWRRVLKPTVLRSTSWTGLVLDPPYTYDLRDSHVYAQDSGTISADVRKCAIEHGHDERLRIVLCGLEGEHEMPADWRTVAWMGPPGMSRKRDREDGGNRTRERLWLSPHCLPVEDAAPAQTEMSFATGGAS